ncbi:aspartyl protease family protein [Cytophagaceae bacterium YF14B1]|uniref:Aspartyl protease family protein n=1 Tax=Xanthocytophaga flava TaxID=3048013 RepID=A0AAE3QXT8_9BACT|nr:aspartyl protease family protein [Xanthocytophaga flavus]MDJ1485201.1 aspartyl protease family protein [Xanthocytophaga flavus]
MCKIGTLILCYCLSYSLFGQGKAHSIPFRLTEYNNISVKAILNEKDTVNLMFHSAANFVTLTEEAVSRLKTITFQEKTEGIKSWGGDVNSARFSEKNTLQIGDLTWKDLPLWENKNSGRNTDGKIGIDLFKDKVIELDFEKQVMIVSESLPARSKKYKKHKLVFENDYMFLEANCKVGDSTLTNRFLIHSGYSGAILFDDAFTGEHKLGEKLKITSEKKLTDSYGNVVKTKQAILPELKIGNETLSNVPVGFFEGAIGRQKMSVLGGEIIKRFSIIIDARREYIYLKPNRLKGMEYAS